MVIDPDVPWEDDPGCRYAVERHPRGLTHAQIGTLMGGLSRERIRQIEARALAKLRRLARRDRKVGEALGSLLTRQESPSHWDEMRLSE